jgi:autotransporter-associated beta strand protein
MFTPAPATAATTTWTWSGGSSTSSNFSDSGNWGGTVPTATTASGYTFAGSTRLNPTIDSGTYSVTTLNFDKTAGAFTIGASSGGTLMFANTGSAINQASTNTEIVNASVYLNTSALSINFKTPTTGTTCGNLTLNSILFDSTSAASNVISVNGDTNILGSLTLGTASWTGAVGSSALSLTSHVTGVTFTDTTFAGLSSLGLSYNGVTITAGNAGGFTTSAAISYAKNVIFSGANSISMTGGINLGGQAATIDNITTAGVTLGSAGSSYLLGYSNGSAASETFQVTTGGTMTIAGNLTQNTAGGSGTITIAVGASGYNGTLIFLGNNSFSGQINFNSNGGTLQIGNGGTVGNLGTTGNITFAGANDYLYFNRSDNVNVSNVMTGNYGYVTQMGSGTMTLTGASTWAGKTSIRNGAISVSSINSTTTNHQTSSNLGAPTTTANGTIDLGYQTSTGALIYTGAGETTDRVVNLAGTTGGGAIEADGSGALVFSSALTGTGVGAKTFTLQGSNTAANTFAGAIVNGSGTAALTKAGSGKWVLSGANTFTGGVALNGGVLQVNATESAGTSGALGKSGTISFGGGTLQYSTANAYDYSSRFSKAANQAISVDTNGRNVTFATGLTSSGGSLSLNDTSVTPGTLTLSAANTYSGATNVTAGTLQIDGDNSGATGNVTVSLGATLSGSGGIIGGAVDNSGTISGSLTFNNDVTVNHGAMASASAFNGNIVDNGTITSAVNVQSGRTLSGTGSVSSGVTVQSGGKTNPGSANTPGKMTVDLTYESGATANFNVSSTNPNNGSPLSLKSGLAYSQIVVSGSAGAVNLQVGTGGAASQIQATGASNSNVTLEVSLTLGDFNKLTTNATNSYMGGQSNSSLDNYFVFTLGSGLESGLFQTLDINIGGTDYTGTIYYSGTNDRFNGVANLGDVTANGQEFAVSYVGDASSNSTVGGNDLVLTAVPEPSTWAMMVGGIGILISFQRLRKNRAEALTSLS